MEYRVDFNYIKELQLVGIRRNNLFNLIKSNIFLIKFFSKLVYI